MFVFRQAMVMCFFGSVLMKHFLVKTKEDNIYRRVGRSHARDRGHATDRDYMNLVSDAGKKKLPGIRKITKKLLDDKAIKKLIKKNYHPLEMQLKSCLIVKQSKTCQQLKTFLAMVTITRILLKIHFRVLERKEKKHFRALSRKEKNCLRMME